MLEMLLQWYRRRFTDPQAIALLVILLAGFCILYFFHGILTPLLVAIVLAYLLEWPTARLQRIGCSRTWAASMVLVVFWRYRHAAGVGGGADRLAAGHQPDDRSAGDG
ncbi:Domain of uncharacterised function DUF20 [Serratia odorifera]|uniref:Domain of uncharacterized function DUF20 n=1 Tax=Serratia odorifera TaxID=618 RepID=A0A447KTV0_SEROD|nr:Domain of uncharacterised function DUF20 [Serratia odorifera]